MELNAQTYWQEIKSGNKLAFEQMFKDYYKALCNYACQYLKDMDEAEEVVQNMFYNLWSKKESIEVNTSIKSYLYRIVHNESLNKIKHAKVRQVYAEDYKSTMSSSFVDSSVGLQAKELNTRINLAINSLPEQCGVVFKLSRFENLKYSEIAEQLGISIKTVENHMGKALKLLREQLKDYLPAIVWLLIIN